jgi:quercetin dioxygenase-like cupin family protein
MLQFPTMARPERRMVLAGASPARVSASLIPRHHLPMKRFLFLLLLTPFLAAQTATEVEITAEPSHHLAIDNEYIRAFKVEVAPHSATLMHRHHHDYIYVTLGDAHLSNEVEGKPPVDVKLSDGETRFAPGNFAHIARNLSDQPFRNVTVELMQDEKLRQTPSHWREESGEKSFAGGSSKILFVKDGVRVSEVDLDPGAIMPRHHHDLPHLLVAVTDLDLRSDVDGQGPMPGKFKAGDIKWLPGGYTHTLTNAGKIPARLVTVEF